MRPSPEAPPRGALDRWARRLALACGVLAAVAVVAILAIVCIETVLRQFDASLLVTDEIAGYLNAAAIFLGLAWTLREGGFIRVELLYDRAVGKLKQALRWLIVLTATVFSAVTLWVCIRQVIYAFDRDTRAVSIIDTPEWIPQSMMVLGLAVLLLQLVAWIVDRVRHIP
ncbi:TRAP-type C4-dicarboxylate transport system, small permease component [Rhodospirillales bacterium URHD0017]|nr:TRAP-type C4-dicarboxylate transport system, small permease component [Rhodospirillales bacterium URHD0017]